MVIRLIVSLQNVLLQTAFLLSVILKATIQKNAILLIFIQQNVHRFGAFLLSTVQFGGMPFCSLSFAKFSFSRRFFCWLPIFLSVILQCAIRKNAILLTVIFQNVFLSSCNSERLNSNQCYFPDLHSVGCNLDNIIILIVTLSFVILQNVMLLTASLS